MVLDVGEGNGGERSGKGREGKAGSETNFLVCGKLLIYMVYASICSSICLALFSTVITIALNDISIRSVVMHACSFNNPMYGLV